MVVVCSTRCHTLPSSRIRNNCTPSQNNPVVCVWDLGWLA
jgi:hypothetical protein